MSDVFISYSRKDIAFARLIQQALQQSEIDTWIDWERIPIGEQWWKEICEAIAQANVFMFIISLSSIGSKVCKDEIDQAIKNHKRIIPIIVDDLKPEVIQEFAPDLPKINWIIFEKDHVFQIEENPEVHSERPEDHLVALPKLPQFKEALERLSVAIHTDWDWVKFHTRLQLDALRWESNQKDNSFLIRGTGLNEAEQQLFRASSKDPRPTDLQVEYVTTSRQEETLRQQERLILEQKSRRRQRMVLWAVGIGLTVAVGLAIIAWGQRNQYLAETHVRATAQADAVSEANARATQESIAVTQKNEADHQAKIAIAGEADANSTMLQDKQIDLALLLSIEGYRVSPGPQTSGSILNTLLASSRLIRELHGTQFTVRGVAYSPDGKLLATDGCGLYNADFTCAHSETDLWNTQTGQLVGKLIGDTKTAAAAAITFSSDGQQLFTFSDYGNVVIWDLKTMKTLDKILWHDHYLDAIAIQPGGKLVALGECAKYVEGIEAQFTCQPGLIELWDTTTRLPLKQSLTGNPGTISALAFSRDGKYLAAGDYDGKLILWNLQTGVPKTIEDLGIYNFFGNLIFSPDSGTLIASDSTNKVSFINIDNGKLLHQSIQFSEMVDSIAISPDGKTLITAFCSIGTGSAGPKCSSEITFWDILTGVQIGQPLKGYSEYVSNLIFSPDGSMLAGGNNAVYLWDARNPEPLATQLPINAEYDQVVFNPDGSNLVAGGFTNSFTLWNVVKNKVVEQVNDLSSDIRVINFSPANDAFDTFDPDNGIVRWSTSNGTPVKKFMSQYKDSIPPVAFSPDASLLATRQGKILHLWDANSGKLLISIDTGLDLFTTLAFSPTGDRIAVAGCAPYAESKDDLGNNISCSQGQVNIYQVSTQASLMVLKTGQPDAVYALVFSQDGKQLATSTMNVIQFWDLSNSIRARVTVNLLNLLSGNDSYLFPDRLTFSQDGKYLAGMDFQKQLFLIDTSDGKMVSQAINIGENENLGSLTFIQDNSLWLGGDVSNFLIALKNGVLSSKVLDPSGILNINSIVDQLALSPDGHLLATGTTLGTSITLWDMTTSVPTKRFTLEGHSETVESVIFSPDSKILYSISQDMTLDCWNTSTGQLIDQPMKGYIENSSPYPIVAFSKDGKWAASSTCRVVQGSNCSQGEIDLWSMETGEITQFVNIPYQIFALAFSPDDHWLVDSSGIENGISTTKGSVEIHAWDLTTTPPTSHTLIENQDDYFRPLVFSPDGKTLAALSRSGGKLTLLDFQTGETLPIQPGLQEGSYSDLAFSPDGSILALESFGAIQLYDLISGQVIGPAITGMPVNGALQFRQDGKKLASGRPATLWTIDPTAWIARACQIANRNLTQDEWKTYFGDQPYHQTCTNLP